MSPIGSAVSNCSPFAGISFHYCGACSCAQKLALHLFRPCSVLTRQSHRQAAKVLLASDTMRLKQIRENVERFGAVKAFQDVALRGLNVAVPARILKVVKVETV